MYLLKIGYGKIYEEDNNINFDNINYDEKKKKLIDEYLES